MYSAIKKDGQPLYKLARAGKEIERAAREIEIFELRLAGSDGGSLRLETLCAKGTYIRVLAEDIARALGSCGHVTRLRRTYVEPFEGEAMETLESDRAARAASHPGRRTCVLGIWRRFDSERARPRSGLQATVRSVGRARHAGRAGGGFGCMTGAGCFMGIGEAQGGACVRPRRLWVEGSAGRIARLVKG